MKTRILSFFTLFLMCHSFVKADIDITDLYLENAGFDDANYYDYKVSDYGNVAQEILSIYGWNKDIGVDYTVTGIYELGTGKTFNTMEVTLPMVPVYWDGFPTTVITPLVSPPSLPSP